MNESRRTRLARRLAYLIGGPESLAAVSVRVDDSPGWMVHAAAPHDRSPAEIQELYQDTLTAWRKNPIAKRIVDITTDYVVGDQITITSPHRRLARFIEEFWSHPKNRMAMRLEAMCDELTRAGDLFVVLFRNPQDGMSYVRFVPKDQIQRIEVEDNDWETEIAYHETPTLSLPGSRGAGEQGSEGRLWLSPEHPAAPEAPAVMLHYAINRPIGALLGEGDLNTLTPWLLRYSRMLEDRVRLHWALRAFLWVVTVPTNRVAAKQEQYRTPPEAGSIVIKDSGETWEAQAPILHAADAQHDLKAVRGMIDAGSGFPPHWRGEAAEANLATATAMQAPTERHLLRRQLYFITILQDMVYQAYTRAYQVGAVARPPAGSYADLFHVLAPDISRTDNQQLAQAGRDLAQAFATLARQLPGRSPTLGRVMLEKLFYFIGQPQDEATVQAILAEMSNE
ncbi:MAG: hypothetical protein AB1791_19220 [Chloroflexota bacterium]